MAEIQSPHTNAARLPNYIGRTVRLWGKVLKVAMSTFQAMYTFVSNLSYSYKVTPRSYKPVMVAKSK